VLVGTESLVRLPERFLRRAFATILVATAVLLFLQGTEALGRGGLSLALDAGLVGIGVVAGVLAGLLGVGGGVVTVPALVLLFGIPDAVARGTSLAVIIPTAVLGTVRNARHRNLDTRVAAVAGPVGAISAFAAARLGVGLAPRLSTLLFAALLVVVAAYMLVPDRRRPRPPLD
ncbi:MAG: sulfite exporter TauE/SafE family protein, partial [Actinomycetota bacterium]|nr:sulfite exporter TauE/SafE family protein [Actinomycetota bacterium]